MFRNICFLLLYWFIFQIFSSNSFSFRDFIRRHPSCLVKSLKHWVVLLDRLRYWHLVEHARNVQVLCVTHVWHKHLEIFIWKHSLFSAWRHFLSKFPLKVVFLLFKKPSFWEQILLLLEIRVIGLRCSRDESLCNSLFGLLVI